MMTSENTNKTGLWLIYATFTLASTPPADLPGLLLRVRALVLLVVVPAPFLSEGLDMVLQLITINF